MPHQMFLVKWERTFRGEHIFFFHRVLNFFSLWLKFWQGLLPGFGHLFLGDWSPGRLTGFLLLEFPHKGFLNVVHVECTNS